MELRVWRVATVLHKTGGRLVALVVFNASVTNEAVSDYRVAPTLAARLLGVGVGLVGVLVLLTTAVVALAGLPPGTVLMVGVAGVLLVGLAGWWVTRRARVVRLDDVGYQVRFVRGAGATSARWVDVLDAGTRAVAGSHCVVLRLRDGRTTTIPVEALAGDPARFANDIAARLARARR